MGLLTPPVSSCVPISSNLITAVFLSPTPPIVASTCDKHQQKYWRSASDLWGSYLVTYLTRRASARPTLITVGPDCPARHRILATMQRDVGGALVRDRSLSPVVAATLLPISDLARYFLTRPQHRLPQAYCIYKD
jgi:hypothetical protein